MKNKKYTGKVKVGEIYRAKTFAGVEVHTKITKIADLEKGFYVGVLVRPQDVEALRKMQVPWPKNANPEDCESWVYDFHIVSKVRKRRNSGASKEKIEETKVGSTVRRRRRSPVEALPVGDKRRSSVRGRKNRSVRNKTPKKTK